MRVAVPPAAGIVQMLPWRSTASVRPSGETATDIDVPSLTTTSTVAAGAGPAGRVPADCARETSPALAAVTITRRSEQQRTRGMIGG